MTIPMANPKFPRMFSKISTTLCSSWLRCRTHDAQQEGRSVGGNGLVTMSGCSIWNGLSTAKTSRVSEDFQTSRLFQTQMPTGPTVFQGAYRWPTQNLWHDAAAPVSFQFRNRHRPGRGSDQMDRFDRSWIRGLGSGILLTVVTC